MKQQPKPKPKKQTEFIRVERFLAAHIQRFQEDFKSKGKLPRSKDWRPYRFAVRDALIGVTVIRHQFKENTLEVDICATEDPDAFEGYSGTKIVLTFLLSEAYLCGSTMGIRFTSDFGRKRVPVYFKIEELAFDLGVELKYAKEGFITPKESRMLYLALTNFSSEALQKVKELAVANVVTPERICYLVHHGTWSLEEMESILLGSENPETILRATTTPLDFLLYADMLMRCRTAILGSFLDRKLRLKEVVEGNKVIDLEGGDREFRIMFDSRFFAKVYETLEDTPIPWTNKPDWAIPAGHRLIVALRAYDWPDLTNYFHRDIEAMRQMVASYQDGTPTHFFFLVPRDVLSSQQFGNLRSELEKISVTLMMCPELLVRLDDDAQQRLAQMESIRHDIATGEAAKRQIPISRSQFVFNNTQLTFITVSKDMKDGIVQLEKLFAQALYDERELKADVNRRNVETRYIRVMDRISFLAKLALGEKNTPRVSFPRDVFEDIASYVTQFPDESRSARLSSMLLPYELLEEVINKLQHKQTPLPHLAQLIPFLQWAKANDRTVIVLLDHHTKEDKRGGAKATAPIEQLEPAFRGLFVADRVIDYSDKTIPQVAEQVIWNAVNAAKVGRANAVNLNEWPHMVITQVLHTFSYRELKDSNFPLSINITYTDGSKARQFPLFRLRRRSKAEMKSLRELKPREIGMLSCRHPEMDEMIDWYWLRNIDMNMAGNTLAEKDEFAYQTSKEQLALILTRNTPARMHFYQTGYPPVVVGFYRAVVEFLMETQGQPPCLEVFPCFYNRRSDDYDKGKSWC
jgi:hypothetical protein